MNMKQLARMLSLYSLGYNFEHLEDLQYDGDPQKADHRSIELTPMILQIRHLALQSKQVSYDKESSWC